MLDKNNLIVAKLKMNKNIISFRVVGAHNIYYIIITSNLSILTSTWCEFLRRNNLKHMKGQKGYVN